MTRVKICGLTRRQDLEAAVEAGADAVGFVYEPSSPRFVGGGAAPVAELIACVPPFVTSVAVFGPLPANPPREALLCDALQCLAGSQRPPARRWIAAVRLGGEAGPKAGLAAWEGLLSESGGAEGRPDAVLVDASGHGYGGTGMLADWEAAAELVRAADVPVILAGGLTADNVGEAIGKVRPYAVDVSSGVEERPGVKDPAKVRAFLEAVRASVVP